MRRIFFLALGFGAWLAAEGRAVAFTPFSAAEPESFFNCGYSYVSASFTAKVSSYSIGGACLHSTSQIQVPWSGQGRYEPASGNTTETIYLSGPPPYRGTLTATMTCAGLRENQDPWLTKVICGSFHLTPQGEFAAQKELLDAIYQRMQSRGGPLTTSFPYDRNVLLAKRDADLKLELARAEEERRRSAHILQGADKFTGTSYTANLSPSIWSPTVGQMFYSKAPVAIKLVPPKGLTGGSYMVNIQRLDATGKKWVAHATIPVGGAQAHSAGGYTGWGSGGSDGRSLAFMSSPGSWRLSAQVSSPKQSAWSNWVNFNVMAPQSPTATKPKRVLPGQ